MSLLEVIALDATDARAAAVGGADRLELVTDMSVDGLTPPARTVAEIRSVCTLRLRVMLRLRDDFTAADLEELAQRSGALAAAGADGFVLGFLTTDSMMDLNAMRFLARATGRPWTCHRVVDHARDYAGALADVRGLPGLDQVLTSGHPKGVSWGMAALSAAAATAPVMAGGGLRPEHVPALRAAGVTAFHVGSGARPDWGSPVSSGLVAGWRELIDDSDRKATDPLPGRETGLEYGMSSSTLLGSAPVIDGHNDLLIRLRGKVRYDFDALDIAHDQTGPGLHTDIPRMRAGGLGGQFWSVFVPVDLAGEAAVAATLEQIDAAHEMIARYDDLVLATSANDIDKAFVNGGIASLLGAEGGHSIACSLGTLRMLYRLGVRYLTLTHTSNTPWADSATDVVGVGGLSEFGREVVREMNRLGMMADLSHVAPSTMHDTLDVSEAPAFFSHSNAKALCGHARNVPDDVLRRVGETGGIVMASFVPGFLTQECREWVNAFESHMDIGTVTVLSDDTRDDQYEQRRARKDAWMADNPPPPSSAADVADHIEHIREVAGVNCVGIGGDLDGIGNTPADLTSVADYPNLIDVLSGRGWSDDDLSKLTRRNVIRVLRETESVAEAVRARRGPSNKTIEELDAE